MKRGSVNGKTCLVSEEDRKKKIQFGKLNSNNNKWRLLELDVCIRQQYHKDIRSGQDDECKVQRHNCMPHFLCAIQRYNLLLLVKQTDQ